MSPSRTLPTFLQSEVAEHNTAESCFVTIGTKVYDITDFVDSHPGGGDLILEYGGKDVTEILKDEDSHTHSEAAYEILDEGLVGFMATKKTIDVAVNSARPDSILSSPSDSDFTDESSQNGVDDPIPVFASTGLSTEEDLSKDTDVRADYKEHKFLDLDRPLLMQVWFGGFSKEFYLDQVHRPRHYKGGESAPLFGNFLEPLTKTSWWVIPLVWLPPVAYGIYLSKDGLSGAPEQAAYFVLGLFFWTIVEYTLHRFLFHLDK